MDSLQVKKHFLSDILLQTETLSIGFYINRSKLDRIIDSNKLFA